jgi:hypothetical protein
MVTNILSTQMVSPISFKTRSFGLSLKEGKKTSYTQATRGNASCPIEIEAHIYSQYSSSRKVLSITLEVALYLSSGSCFDMYMVSQNLHKAAL